MLAISWIKWLLRHSYTYIVFGGYFPFNFVENSLIHGIIYGREKSMQLYETIDLLQPSNSVIHRENCANAYQFEKELGVSFRVISRDVDEILGYYYASLDYDQTRHGWDSKDSNFFIKYIQIEEGELFGLDGSVSVFFETTQLPEVKRIILGQGLTVKFLRPKELCDEIKIIGSFYKL